MNSVVYHKLISAFGSSLDVIKCAKHTLSQVDKVSPKLAHTISRLNPNDIYARELTLAEKIGAKIILLEDDDYPASLKNVYCPPPVLYVSGELKEEDNIAIGVVGSRGPTRYGKMATEKLSYGLAERGITVISGLARGIDGIAHKSAISAGGRTIAVLGCGLNVYYPPEHRELQNKIKDHGAVISQFSITTAPDKTRFPQRNRIVSGLSLGTLVIEAAKKSGALITAYASIDDNRDVFALPGPINSPKSDGTNSLIKKGHAKLVTCVEDIIEELPEYVCANLPEVQKSLDLGEENLTEDEVKTLAIVDHEARHIDYFAKGLGLPSNMASAILLTLELKGKVKQLAGMLFIKT